MPMPNAYSSDDNSCKCVRVCVCAKFANKLLWNMHFTIFGDETLMSAKLFCDKFISYLFIFWSDESTVFFLLSANLLSRLFLRVAMARDFFSVVGMNKLITVKSWNQKHRWKMTSFIRSSDRFSRVGSYESVDTEKKKMEAGKKRSVLVDSDSAKLLFSLCDVNDLMASVHYTNTFGTGIRTEYRENTFRSRFYCFRFVKKSENK